MAHTRRVISSPNCPDLQHLICNPQIWKMHRRAFNLLLDVVDRLERSRLLANNMKIGARLGQRRALMGDLITSLNRLHLAMRATKRLPVHRLIEF